MSLISEDVYLVLAAVFHSLVISFPFLCLCLTEAELRPQQDTGTVDPPVKAHVGQTGFFTAITKPWQSSHLTLLYRPAAAHNTSGRNERQGEERWQSDKKEKGKVRRSDGREKQQVEVRKMCFYILVYTPYLGRSPKSWRTGMTWNNVSAFFSLKCTFYFYF